MKITRRQLRQLINEEYSKISERRTRKERKADREDYRERKAEHYKPLRTLQGLYSILGLPGRSLGGGHLGRREADRDAAAALLGYGCCVSHDVDSNESSAATSADVYCLYT